MDAGGEGHHAVHGEGGTSEDRQRAQQQLYDFVSRTLQQLIAVETSRDGATYSSLEHLARLDISVMPAQTGELLYFVNEVERGSGMQLYSGIDPSRSMEMMDELGHTLVKWLDSLRGPFLYTL